MALTRRDVVLLRVLVLALAAGLAASGSVGGDDGATALKRFPRGVDPAADNALAYQQPRFSCETFGGKVSIDASYVNDDYCDCKDGTDEPGTSACLNGKFHCRNRGHQSKTLPASQVNDGYCDCCDGSDENDGRVLQNGQAKCGNKCVTLGASRHTELIAMLARARGGVEKKRAIVTAAPIKRAAWKADIDKLAADIEAQRQKEDKAMKLKSNAERAERVAKAAVAAIQKTEEGKDAAAAAEGGGGDDDAAAAENAAAAAMEDDDFEEVSPAAPDADAAAAEPAKEETDAERGQRIARQWVKEEEPAKEETDEERGQRISRQWVKDGRAESGGDGNAADAAADAAAAAAAADAAEDPEEELTPLFARPTDWDDGEDGVWIPPDDPALSEEADRLRERHSAEKSKLKQLEDKQRDTTVHLSRFMGELDEYAHMIGECYTANIEKYTYKVCPYGDAQQDSTRLGTMGVVSREAPRVFKFTGGEGCWNGPARSITVTLACGGEVALVGVSEPSRCEYAATLLTPAACEEGDVGALEEELRVLEEEVRLAEQEHDEF